MKNFIFLILLFLPAIMYSQNTHDIYFKITDSVIIKKDYPYATKINVEITVSDFQETFFLFLFPNCVASTDKLGYENLSDEDKELYAPMLDKELITLSFFESIGLNCVLENENHIIIKTYTEILTLLCREMPKGRRRPCDGIGTFVNSKQKIIRKQIKPQERLDYFFAKYEINYPKQNLPLYLLLSIYHYDLPKGEYWLYLTYSYKPGENFYYQTILNDSSIFKGSVHSNKVKLIVE